jgi:ABC-type nitrate/sulfonate/bicarbonate transport system permease component
VTRAERRKWRERAISRGAQLAFLAVVIAIWHLATTVWGVSKLLLPKPFAVARDLVGVLGSGAFLPDLRVTLYELVVAFLLAAVTGLVVGYAVSRSIYLVRVFEPFLAGLYAIPTILFFPLFVLFFGIAEPSKIAMGTSISFFPIVLSTIAGFANVDRTLIRAARSMGASNAQMFRCVLLPAAFPVVLTGLRMGFILAFLSVLGAETITSFAGLGHKIVELSENMDTEEMFAYIVFAVGIAALLNILVVLVQGRKEPE